MPTPLKLAPVPADASPELLSAREELGILHDIFAAMGNATMRACEYERAKRVLDYIDAQITDAQARHDALLPQDALAVAAAPEAPAIPSKEPTPALPDAN